MHTGKHWILTLIIAALLLSILVPASAEVKPIALDMLEHGTPPKAEG